MSDTRFSVVNLPPVRHINATKHPHDPPFPAQIKIIAHDFGNMVKNAYICKLNDLSILLQTQSVT